MYTAHVACAIKIAEYRRIDKTTECQKVSIRPKRGRNRHATGTVSFVDALDLYLFFLISWIICGPAVTAPMSAPKAAATDCPSATQTIALPNPMIGRIE